MITLRPEQTRALNALSDGKVLWGQVGSGKSIVALSYWQRRHSNRSLLIITTAVKRDLLEWQADMVKIGLDYGALSVIVDSWNNIKKYTELSDYFVIFDEQRLVGGGAWVKAFYKIAKNNPWVLLTGTPGDTWHDYIPLFVANGWYRNKRDFEFQHVIYDRYARYPKVDRYIATDKLSRLRKAVLVPMSVVKTAEKIRQHIVLPYPTTVYKEVSKQRFDPYKDEPIPNAAALCYVQRRVVNETPDRFNTILELARQHNRLIVFYNYDYELVGLRKIFTDTEFVVRERNGHKHELVSSAPKWVYLVQYASGAEAWNCTTANAMAFVSLSYSYKVMTQAEGRIDRLDTPFDKLYYYYLATDSSIDRAVLRAIQGKKSFNEKAYYEAFLSQE